MVTDEELTGIIAMIAQGVINIDSGHTTIEKGSRVYRAMVQLLEAINTGDAEIRSVRK